MSGKKKKMSKETHEAIRVAMSVTYHAVDEALKVEKKTWESIRKTTLADLGKMVALCPNPEGERVEEIRAKRESALQDMRYVEAIERAIIIVNNKFCEHPWEKDESSR